MGLRLNDLDIKGRKVHLFEGEKNSMGRVVYLSDDALFAIKLWLRRRDKNKEFVFYGQGNGHLCYSTGRGLFMKYLKMQGSIRRATRCIVFAIRLPLSFSTQGCAWNVSSSFSVIRISR